MRGTGGHMNRTTIERVAMATGHWGAERLLLSPNTCSELLGFLPY